MKYIKTSDRFSLCTNSHLFTIIKKCFIFVGGYAGRGRDHCSESVAQTRGATYASVAGDTTKVL